MSESVDRLLDQLIQRWEEALHRGEPLTPETLCEDHPELLEQVREVIEGFDEHPTSEVGLEKQTIPSSFSSAARLPIWYEASFRDIRILAKGGLGVVCTAYDEQLHREVAVKFLASDYVGSHEFESQFRAEAEITGKLQHPGVVPLHGMGQDKDGTPFYVMRLIRGETLDDAIRRYHRESNRSYKERRMAQRKLLGHFVALCNTVGYAHTRGIVHRDIKPANVMLGQYGETLLVDWGLAIPVGRPDHLRSDVEKTMQLSHQSRTGGSTGSGAGTPAFMSPEQARESPEVNQSSDIYSLGATLYYLLTGQASVHGIRSLDEIREMVTQGRIPPPRSVARHVAPELEAICLRAMALRPEERYPTACSMADDIENYLADLEVSAYDEPLRRRLARWSRRHGALLQGMVVGLVAVMVIASWAAVRAQRDSHEKAKLLQQAQAARAAAVASEKRQRRMRIDSMRTSARFAARSLANHIEMCWGILESIAGDRELVAELEGVNAKLKQRTDASQPFPTAQKAARLQEALDRLASRYDRDSLGVRGFALYGVEGTQVARYPEFVQGKRVGSLGRRYAYRDYFHGKGEDYFKLKEVPFAPLKRPHVAAVHRSTNDGKLVIMFSVPIRGSGNGDPIGVLGTGIDLGKLTALSCELPESQDVILVQTRRYEIQSGKTIGGEDVTLPAQGLILYHPELDAWFARNRTPSDELPRISDEAMVNEMDATGRAAAEGGGDVAARGTVPSRSSDESAGKLLDYLYIKQLDGTSSETVATTAAVAPVIVISRAAERKETPRTFVHWAVVVRQRSGENKPASNEP